MIANRVIWYTTGVRLNDYGCSLKVFRAEVVKPIRLYGEMHRFLPAIASEQGVAIGEMVVKHHPRRHGQSKYGISRTIRVILDLMTVKFLISYSTRPLQMFGGVGFAMGTLGTIICAWLAYLRLFGNESIGNRPLLLLGILLILGGVQLLTAGPARGAAVARLSRIHEQTDLRDPRDPRGAGRAAQTDGRRIIVRKVLTE